LLCRLPRKNPGRGVLNLNLISRSFHAGFTLPSHHTAIINKTNEISRLLTKMIAPRGHYLSFLLRIWKDSMNGEWRATLQNVVTGECRHYATLPDLFSFLENQTIQPMIIPSRTNFETKKAG
jgi:hypothetical protein